MSFSGRPSFPITVDVFINILCVRVVSFAENGGGTHAVRDAFVCIANGEGEFVAFC